MSFNPNIPIITDKILQSSAQIRANFRAINNAFADNHVGLTQNDQFSGMHRVLTLRTVTDPTTSATQIAFYNKLVAGIPAMFYRPSSNQTPIQMTYPSLRTGFQSTAPDVYFPTQYSFVAGPFIIYGGYLSNITNPQLVNLSPGTALISVDVILENVKFPTGTVTVAAAAATNIAGTSFTIETVAFPGGSTVNAYYFAVGQ